MTDPRAMTDDDRRPSRLDAEITDLQEELAQHVRVRLVDKFPTPAERLVRWFTRETYGLLCYLTIIAISILAPLWIIRAAALAALAAINFLYALARATRRRWPSAVIAYSVSVLFAMLAVAEALHPWHPLSGA